MRSESPGRKNPMSSPFSAKMMIASRTGPPLVISDCSTEGLQSLITNGGPVLLAIIIFAENGLLIGFFLPGDSLLITAGILIGSQTLHLDFFPLALLLSAAAIIGET